MFSKRIISKLSQRILDLMDPPGWLNSNFLSEVLQKSTEEKVQVTKFHATPAVAPGNNHLSQVFRVEVEYIQIGENLKNVFLIVKVPSFIFPDKEKKEFSKGPPKDLPHKKPENDDFFNMEPRVFVELLPIMNKKVNIDFSPKYYPCDIKGALVLEDLREGGYTMCDRFQQLDYAHCKEVMVILAKFHAVSVACHNDNPKLIESIGEGMDHSKNPYMDGKMKLGMECAVKKVAEITKETHKDFSDLLLSKVDCAWETVKIMSKPQDRKLNVLNHGDLWTTNILFKYSAVGEVEGVKIIDYQLLRYASPAFDVTFFIWTSGNKEVREKHQISLYKIYLQSLNKNLEELGCKERLSQQAFQEYLKDMADVVLSLVCHILPVFMADPEDGPLKIHELDPEDPNNEMIHKLYNGKYYRKILPDIARQYMSWRTSLNNRSYLS